MSSVPIRPARHRFGAGGGCYVVTVPRHSDHGQHPTDDSAEDVRTASARPLRGPTSEDWRSNQYPAMALVFEIADGHLTYGKLAQPYGVHISGMRSRVGGLTKRLHSKSIWNKRSRNKERIQQIRDSRRRQLEAVHAEKFEDLRIMRPLARMAGFNEAWPRGVAEDD
jgi:hypothetical protein